VASLSKVVMAFLSIQIVLINSGCLNDNINKSDFSFKNITVFPTTVEVPSVILLPYEDAINILENEGLKIGEVITEESTEPPGTVLYQEPISGSEVQSETYVNLVLAHPISVEVPSVILLNIEDAINILENEGLKIGEVITEESTEPPGTVLYQEPIDGTRVQRESYVNLSISRETVEVPKIVGLNLDEASLVIRMHNLELGRITYRISTETSGVVLKQIPLEGTNVPVETHIDLTVSAH
jgi:serine/threonine-protein kinase